jgi:hypothetical protein
MKTEIQNTIEEAKKIMKRHNLQFATIWETSSRKTTMYGFNFENVEVGFSEKKDGVKRTAIQIIKA